MDRGSRTYILLERSRQNRRLVDSWGYDTVRYSRVSAFGPRDKILLKIYDDSLLQCDCDLKISVDQFFSPFKNKKEH